MGLPLMLRNCTKTQVFSSLLKSSNGLSVNSRKTYSGLIITAKKNVGINNQKATHLALAKRFMSADHSKMWPVEKIVTLGLLGVAPAALLNPNIVLDDALAILSVAHFHWGLEACVVDYIRPIILGSTIPKISLGLLYLLSFATLGGLLYYNHECIGIGCTFRKIWEIQK